MLLKCIEFLFELWIRSVMFERSVEIFYSYPIASKHGVPNGSGCQHGLMLILSDALLVLSIFLLLQKGAAFSLVRNSLLFVHKDCQLLDRAVDFLQAIEIHETISVLYADHSSLFDTFPDKFLLIF